MSAIGISFLVLLLVYIFLRAHGGSGADISFKIPSYSTQEGKRTRMELIIVFLVVIAAGLFAAIGSGLSREQQYFAIGAFLVIMFTGIVSRLRKNKG